MIGIKIELEKRSERELFRIAKSFPKWFRQAHGRSASAAKRQLYSLVKAEGGKYDVPKLAPHNPITTKLKGDHKMFANAFNRKGIIVSFIKGGVQYIGYPDTKGPMIGDIQESKTYTMSKKARYFLHRRGIDDVPMQYERPQRHIVEPYASYLVTKFPQWVRTNFEKIYKKNTGKVFR